MLYQTPKYNAGRDPKISIDFGRTSCEFVVTYSAGPFGQPFTLHPLESHWTRRSRDGFAALERCLHHLRWFSEYSPDIADSAE